MALMPVMVAAVERGVHRRFMGEVRQGVRPTGRRLSSASSFSSSFMTRICIHLAVPHSHSVYNVVGWFTASLIYLRPFMSTFALTC